MEKHTNDPFEEIKKFLLEVAIFVTSCYITAFLTVMYDRLYTPNDTRTNIIVTGLLICNYIMCFGLYKELENKCKEKKHEWEKKRCSNAKNVRTKKN